MSTRCVPEGLENTIKGLHKMPLRYSQHHPKKKKEGAHNSYGYTWTLQLLYPSSNSPALTTWAERTIVNTWFNDRAVSQVDRQVTPGPTSSPYIIYWTIFSCLISLTPESRLFNGSHRCRNQENESRLISNLG